MKEYKEIHIVCGTTLEPIRFDESSEGLYMALKKNILHKMNIIVKHDKDLLAVQETDPEMAHYLTKEIKRLKKQLLEFLKGEYTTKMTKCVVSDECVRKGFKSLNESVKCKELVQEMYTDDESQNNRIEELFNFL